MEVELGGVRRTGRGYVVADLFVAGVKFRLYMRCGRMMVALKFDTTNRRRAELAVELLRKAGVDAKLHHRKKAWYLFASLRGLAGAAGPLKEAVAASIKAARERGWIDEKTAQRWAAKAKGVPVYSAKYGPAVCSRHPEVLEREAQRLREVGLVEGRHFAVKMPEGGRMGRLRILRRGLAYTAWLSVYGSGKQRELAGELLGRILRAAQEEGGDVYRRVKRAVDEGILRGSLTLRGLEEAAERHRVKIRDASARLKDGRLKIAVEAEVDGVATECDVSFVKMKRGGVAGFAKADTAEEAERVAAVIKTLTGMVPTVARMNNGVYLLRCGEKHLRALIRYAELADAVEKWIEG